MTSGCGQRGSAGCAWISRPPVFSVSRAGRS